MSESMTRSAPVGSRLPVIRVENPLPALWIGFVIFILWTMLVLAMSSTPPHAAANGVLPLRDPALEQGLENWSAWSDRLPIKAQTIGSQLLLGGSLLLGWVWLLTAGLAFVVKPDGIAARAFSRWATLCSLLLITTYELHYSNRLNLAYQIGFALTQSALLEFVLFFPQRVPILLRYPWLHVVARLSDVVLIILFLLAFLLEDKWIGVFRRSQEYTALLYSAISAAVMVWRIFHHTKRRRSQALVSATAVLPLHLLFVVAICADKLCGLQLLMIALPAGFGGALGLIYAMVRNDLWDSELVVPGTGLRRVLIAILSFMGGLLALVLLRSLTMLSVQAQVLLTLALISVSGPMHSFVGTWLVARLFPAEALYRPTVDELIVRFTDLRTRQAVIETVEHTVLSVCACERAKLVSVSSPRRVSRNSEIHRRQTDATQAPSDPGQSSNVPLLALPDAGGESGKTLFRLTQRAIRRALRGAGVDSLRPEQIDSLCNGNLVFVDSEHSMRRTSPGLWAWLLVPVRFREQVIGVLVVSPKQRGQLFSSLDQELLRTIAHQAALALANAIALEELDELRRAEHSVHRERLDRAISTIAAEIAHEIRFPINFFRMLVERQERALHQGKPLSEHDWAEDLDIGREEVARLERMADRLRKMALSRTVQPRPLSLRSITEHVRLLLADRLAAHTFKMELKEGIEVLADPDALIQVLLNLLANAIDASTAEGTIGLTSVADPDGKLRLVVWDDGPGFDAPVARLFEPWFTTKAQGTGLGLAITHRLVRAHGWEIVAERRGSRTCFDVVIPLGEWRFCSTGEISLLESVSSDEKQKNAL